MDCDQALLHAITVQPRSARLGEEVTISFSARNHGSRPTAAATVEFHLPTELEPQGNPNVPAESAAPGEEIVAMLRARVVATLRDRTPLAIFAVLELEGDRYATNVDTLLVRSTPVLDGPASGTFVDRLDERSVRVRAVVTNEGDGPAEAVEVLLPVPDGCERAGTPNEPAAPLDLAPGETIELSLDARVGAPVAEVRADGAIVRWAAGERELPVRTVVPTLPLLAMRSARIEAGRRSGDLVVELENRGWRDAAGVVVHVVPPARTRPVEETATIDEIPCTVGRGKSNEPPAAGRIVRSREVLDVIVAVVRARAAVRIVLPLVFPAAAPDGVAFVELGDERRAVPFTPLRRSDVRLHSTGPTGPAARGETAVLQLHVANAGDLDEEVMLTAGEDGAAARTIAVRSGTSMPVELPVLIPHDASRAHTVCLSLRTRAGEVSNVAVPLRVRARATSGHESVDEGAPRPAAVPRCEIRAPESVFTGVPFPVTLELSVPEPAAVLTVRVSRLARLAYVPGSAQADGHIVLDRGGGEGSVRCALFGEGFTFRDVPAGAPIRIVVTLAACEAADEGDAMLSASARADGLEATDAAAIAVRPRAPFPSRPPALPYHLDGYLVPIVSAHDPGETRPHVHTVTPDEAPVAVTVERWVPALRFDELRCAELARLQGAFRGDGLVAHLFAVRLFFAGDASGGSIAGRTEVEQLRAAVLEQFDRIYVKLRIPGFTISCDDLDGPQLRAALVAVLRRGEAAVMHCGEVDAIERAPYGAPAALRALISLLPVTSSDAAFDDAFSGFVLALDGVLARYDDVPLELFDDALARLTDETLDDARERVLAALAPYLAPARIAC